MAAQFAPGSVVRNLVDGKLYTVATLIGGVPVAVRCQAITTPDDWMIIQAGVPGAPEVAGE